MNPTPAFRPRVNELESRLTPAGSQIPAGEFNWLQVSPAGTLTELIWSGPAVVYRTRAGQGWVNETVAADPGGHGSDDYSDRQTVVQTTGSAQLLFSPDGTPNVFVLGSVTTRVPFQMPTPDFLPPGVAPPHPAPAGFHWEQAPPDPMTGESMPVLAPNPMTMNESSETGIHHYRRAADGWQRIGLAVPATQAMNLYDLAHLTGAVGPDGAFHLAFDLNLPMFDNQAVAGGVYHATNAGGAWALERVAGTQSLFPYSVGDRYAVRYLSMAVDSRGHVHLTYTPDFHRENFGTVFSQLGYATNSSGRWATQVVYSPPEGRGDAGLAASVAVGPGDRVAIASYNVRRAPTGSATAAELLYHARRADGGWDTSAVVSRPDGYAAGDGANYTGFSPQLAFEGGSPVILFSDVGAQHLPRTSANAAAGQIRTATLTPGGWALRTLFRQSSPLTEQVHYPVMASYGGRPVFAALRVTNGVDAQGEVVDGRYDYQLIDLDAPDVPVPDPGTPGGARGFGAVGADAGGGPVVMAFAPDGSLRWKAMAFDPAFTGGVRVASADFNGDGVPDVVAGTGPGVATLVRVLDGRDGRELFSVRPFEATFTGGVFVAAGDLEGDGVPELVVTPDQGGGPVVVVYDGARIAAGRPGDEAQVARFFGIDDPAFRGGARASVGDLSGDGAGDLVVAAGFGGGPRVAAFDGRSIPSGPPARLFPDFFVFEQSLRNGVFVAAGDLDGDRQADLVVGGGPGGGPRVFALSGEGLLAGRPTQLANFFAGLPSDRAGVRVAVGRLDGDGRGDLVVGAGGGAGSRVTAYAGRDVSADGTPPELKSFEAFPGFGGGVFVG